MGGVAFPMKGSAGAATQTVWFGAIVDRLNMLCPSQFPTDPYTSSVAPAHYGNLWVTFRSSFGAFTTAPDGTTNTAQLLSEDTSNNTHFIQAGSLASMSSISGAISPGHGLGVVRIAGYFKNSGRRLGFQVQTVNDNLTLKVVFDLAGGQVGVAASVSGSSAHGILTTVGTQIIPAANGFYLCIQDFYYKDDNGGLIVASCFLDSGTGTGALSNSYTGNGTSGAYCWRTNMMPAAAWGISNTIFFDDFLSSSTVDFSNTKAAGFNWYPSAGTWLNYLGDPGAPYGPSSFTLSGSVLTCLAPDSQAAGGVMVGTATQVNAAAGTYVGQGFGGGKPTLLEGKLSFTSNNQETGLGESTWWCSSLEWIVAQGQGQTTALASQAKFPGCEFDLVQGPGPTTNQLSTDALAYVGVSGAFGVTGNGAVVSLTNATVPVTGNPVWVSTYDYGTNFLPGQAGFVTVSGTAYQTANNPHNVNHTPPNATFWTALTPHQTPTVADSTQMHVYSHLILPYSGQAGISGGMAQQTTLTQFGPVSGTVQDPSLGIKISFYDGLWCNTSGFWGPNITFNYPGTSASYIWLCDAGHLALWLAAGQFVSLSADYIRVMQ